MQQANANSSETVSTAKTKKVLIFIVCYNAEKSIESVLDRIPKDIWESKRFSTEILIIDDRSPDRTLYIAEEYRHRYPQPGLRRQPENRVLVRYQEGLQCCSTAARRRSVCTGISGADD
jgi:glycosyltransferase involved in cell wall biosynthesis